MDASKLGRDFLTWLWFKSEERDGSIMIPDIGDIKLSFLQRLVFESGEGEYSQTIVCQGFQTDLKEGKIALREGKKIKEARIRMDVGANQWEFTFKADQFQFQSLKLPAASDDAENDEGIEGIILERLYLTESAMEMMENLFSVFLEKRLSPPWATEEMPRLKKWLIE